MRTRTFEGHAKLLPVGAENLHCFVVRARDEKLVVVAEADGPHAGCMCLEDGRLALECGRMRSDEKGQGGRRTRRGEEEELDGKRQLRRAAP